MSMNWSWNGWSIQADESGRLDVRTPAATVSMTADEATALADVIASIAQFAELRAGAEALPTAPTVTAPKAPAKAKEANPPASAPSTPKKRAPAKAIDAARSRQGSTLRIDGEPVKRGPRAAQARFETTAKAKPQATKPAGKPKAEPKSKAAEPAAASDTKSGFDTTGLQPAVAQVISGLDKRARLVEPLVRWMAEIGRPVSMDEIVSAAKEGGWSKSDNPAPALNASMQRHANLFARNPDNTFALRVAQPEAKVIRRRSRAARES
ncbi:MAG: hypothetical protein RIT45_713 [Pseudomonadota bacterium]|jgi:pyruvate/2-oxoglutarate dehydrogenase complex dihydrolipoamide acyltransferase (E2) component